MAIDTATLEISELEKYIILLAYVDDEPIHGRQKLQLIMYVLGTPYPEIREWCNFTIKDDGPHSTILEDTLERLVQMNMLAENDDVIQLTKHSIEHAKAIVDEKGGMPLIQDIFDIKIPQVCSNHKSTLNDITIPEMLSYMYCHYPYMTKGSKTYEKLKPNIKEHIISMYVKEKITLGRAGELLGMPKHIIMDEMAKRKLLRIGN